MNRLRTWFAARKLTTKILLTAGGLLGASFAIRIVGSYASFIFPLVTLAAVAALAYRRLNGAWRPSPQLIAALNLNKKEQQ